AVRAAGVFAGWSSQLRRCDDIPAGIAELYQGTVTWLIQFQDVDVHDRLRLRAKRFQRVSPPDVESGSAVRTAAAIQGEVRARISVPKPSDPRGGHAWPHC